MFKITHTFDELKEEIGELTFWVRGDIASFEYSSLSELTKFAENLIWLTTTQVEDKVKEASSKFLANSPVQKSLRLLAVTHRVACEKILAETISRSSEFIL